MSAEKAKERNAFDLTTGGILNKLLLVAIPIMGTQIIQMTYNLTDMFWLGRVGSDAVAASGTVGMYMWLSMAFVMIGRLGAEIGVSQNLGRGDRDAAKGYAQTAFTLSFIIGALYGGVLLIWRTPMVGFFNIQEAHVARQAEEYLAIICIGVPFTFLSSAVTGIFNGSGNSRIPFYINAVGLVINMILDPLLILNFGMGVRGAAIATIAAQIVAALLSTLSLLVFKSRPFERFRIFAALKLSYLKQIFKWALPVAVESFLFTFLSMFISRLVASWGAGALAAQRVSSQVESLSWLIAGGFSSALAAYVGQNYGANKWGRIHRGFRLSCGAMAGWGLVVTAFLFFGGRFIFKIFLPNDPAALEIGGTYLRILSLCQLIACFEGVAAGAFRGMGKTLPPSIISITSNVFRVLLAYYLSSTSLGLTGVWWAITIGATIRGLWMLVWYLLYARTTPQKDLVENPQ